MTHPFLHLETDPAGLGDPAGAAPPDDGGDVPDPEDVWQGPSQEEWQQTQEALAYFAQQEQARQREQTGQNGGLGPPPDPAYEPEAFAEWLDKRDEQRLAPFQQFTEQAHLTEAEERAYDILTDVESREGEFLLRETSDEVPVSSPQFARAIAEDLLPQAQERYGQGPRAAEAALTEAYKVTRAWEDAVAKAALERRDNQLATLTGARREPAAGAAEGTQVIPAGGDENDVMARYFPHVPSSIR